MNSVKQETNCIVWLYVYHIDLSDSYHGHSLYSVGVAIKQWMGNQLPEET